VGIVHPATCCSGKPLEDPAAELAFMEVAKAAWHELGAAFLEARARDGDDDDGPPWALDEFGPPRGASEAA
jgi:hypothetical protein